MSQAPPASDSTSPPTQPAFLRRHAGKLIASAVITVGIVYTVRKGGLKFVPEGGDFAQVRWWVLPLYAATYLAMTWFRAVRWRFLLRSMAEVPKTRLFVVSCVGFAAILILPFRIGEIVRPYMIRTPPGRRGESLKPVDRAITLTAATSSIIAERVVDGLFLSLVLAVVLFFVPTVHPLPDRVIGLPVTVESVRMSGYAMPGVFAVAFSVIATFYFARSWAHRATFAVIGKVSLPLAERLAGTFEKLADGLHVFGRGKDAFGFFVETTIYWALNAGGMWLLAWGCGVEHSPGSPATFGEACALMGMLGCAILIPGPPGLLGVFQAGIYAAMTMYYPTRIVTGPGSAYVFLLYSTQVLITVALGGVALAFDRGAWRALKQAEAIVPAPADAR